VRQAVRKLLAERRRQVAARLQRMDIRGIVGQHTILADDAWRQQQVGLGWVQVAG